MLAAVAWKHRREGWGIPVMAVCGTVVAWYHGDALYNDYATLHAVKFTADVRDVAWMQVVLFSVCFAAFAPAISRQFNRSVSREGSYAVRLISVEDPLTHMQRGLTLTFQSLALIWIALSVIALLIVDFDVVGLFLPWLGRKTDPWARGRFGGGVDFLKSVVGYVNIFCLATFGVVAALTKSHRLRYAALFFMFLSWPAVLLDRTRNSMLAVCMPAVLCIVFIRLKHKTIVQIAILLATFLLLESWFAFVMQHRTNESIAYAFVTQIEGRDSTERPDAVRNQPRHLGLNMYEELCWINTFLRNGTYEANWGERYFAEAVNFIPRTVWRNKPAIGLDYAAARGQRSRTNRDWVHATISTGMVGQGVVNFGPWLGPVAAAVLMGIWVAILAHFDLTGNRFGRLPLYALGLALTFNLGRDITLLVAYPLTFGYIIVRVFEARARRTRRGSASSSRLGSKVADRERTSGELQRSGSAG